MAIEITPTPKVKIPIWSVFLFLVCFVVFLGLAGSYVYFYISSNKMTEEIGEKNRALTDTAEEKALSDEMVYLERKIDKFAALLSRHEKTANVFGILENLCHPEVRFTEFKFSSEDHSVALNGKAQSFIALGQQVSVLRSQEELTKVNLAGLSLGSEGDVDFVLQLVFDPGVFK